MKSTISKISLVFVLWGCTINQLSAQFSVFNQTFPGLSYGNVAWGDLDNDGDPDLVLSGETSGGLLTTHVFRNDDTSFSPVSTSIPGFRWPSLALTDLNLDGYVDLVITGNVDYAETGIRIVYGPLLSNPTIVQPAMIGIQQGTVDWGDVDQDGDPDILLSGYSGTEAITRLYRNERRDLERIFEEIPLNLPGTGDGFGQFGDYDRDGDLDILISGGFETHLYKNIDPSPLFDEVNTSLPPMYSASGGWCDYNSDGYLDVLLVGRDQSYDNLLGELYRFDNSNKTFIKAASIKPTRETIALWADFTNDGRKDILYLANGFNRIHINALPNPFVETFAGIANGDRVATADIDGDGDLDLAMVSATGSLIYVNVNSTTNQRPTQPGPGTNTLTSTNSVRLSWTPSTDTETAAQALTYNIRVGTQPGGQDIATAMALTDGTMKVPNARNARATTSYDLNNLPDGTFYWSVQAVDQTDRSSPFSDEFQFFHNGVPKPPDMVSAVAVYPNVELTWSRSVSDDVKKYRIYSGNFHNSLQQIDSLVADGSNEWTRTLSGFEPDNRHYFAVTAVDSINLASRYSGLAAIEPTLFHPLAFSGRPLRWGSSDWGDFDNDGDLDLLVCGWGTDGAWSQILVNHGGVFSDLNASLQGVGGSAARWGDFDKDGDLDVVVAGEFGTQIGTEPFGAWYRNTGSSFVRVDSSGLLPDRNVRIQSADIDNDGDLDLVRAGTENGGNLRIYRNTGGRFLIENTGVGSSLEGSLELYDLEGDGDLDIWSGGVFGSVMKNEDGFFSGSSFIAPGRLFPSDWDVDGDADVLVVSPESATLLALDAGSFVQSGISFERLSEPSVDWGDYDNDGDPDVVMAGIDSNGRPRTWLYRNDRTSFKLVNAAFPNLQHGSVQWGDADNDGRLDLFMTGDSADIMAAFVLRNEFFSNNTTPAPPTALNAAQTDSTVLLSWLPGSDLETPADGLSYQVRIWDLPRGFDVTAHMADHETGQRRLAETGPVRGTSMRVHGLESGWYYWSVQSIDGVFKGSPFAPKDSFRLRTSKAPIHLTLAEDSLIVRLVWTSYPGPDFVRYRILMGTSLASLTPVDSTDDASDTIRVFAELLRDSTYYFRIDILDNENFTMFSPVLSITVRGYPVFLSSIASPIRPFGFGNITPLDVDLDGDLDLFVASQHYESLFQKGPGGYTELPDTWPFLTPNYGSVTDYDLDGDPDLFLAGTYYGSELLENNQGVLSASRHLSTMYRSFWGDIDNDGDPDLIAGGTSSSNVYINDGGILNLRQSLTPMGVGLAAFSDYDRDGWLDVLIAGGNATSLYRNDHGSFVPSGHEFPSKHGYVAGGWADFDQDGDDDLLLSGWYESPPMLYVNHGTHFTGILVDSTVGEATWVDYDNDGDPDIGMVGKTRSRMLLNVHGTFKTGETIAETLREGTTLWADIDDDGDKDLVSAGYLGTYGTTTFSYRNLQSRHNDPPLPPTVLTSSVDGARVLLTWNSGQDGQTATAALTYNLRLATKPDLQDIVSASSNPETGARTIEDRGNRGLLKEAQLNMLANGVYYWAVQSIDAGLQPSLFSPVDSFVITSGVPTTPRIAAARQGPQSITLSWFTSPSDAGVQKYLIYLVTDDRAVLFDSTTGGANDTSIVLDGLLYGNTYTFQVAAVNPAGQSRRSDPLTVQIDIYRGLSVSILQNPLVTSAATVVINAYTTVSKIPEIEIILGDVTLRPTLQQIPGTSVFHAPLVLRQEGLYEIRAVALAPGPDTLTVTRSFNARFGKPGQSLELPSERNDARLSLPPGALKRTTILISTLDSLNEGLVYSFAPGLDFFETATVSIRFDLESVEDPGKLFIAREIDEEWVPMPTRVYPNEQTIRASVKSGGRFKIAYLPNAATSNLVPDRLRLARNYPNPFNPSTTIEFELPEDGRTQLMIFNVLGQRVRSLIDETMTAGYHRMEWDGKNEQGGAAASGVYVVRLTSTAGIRSKKILLMK